MKGCGRDLSCFRVCRHRPHCDSDGAEYMVTMDAKENPGDIKFKLGGYVFDEKVNENCSV